MKKITALTPGKIFMAGVIAVLVFFVWTSVAFQEIFSNSILPYFESIAQANACSSLLVFIVFAALSAMLSPFSSIPLVPIAVVIWGNTLTGFLLLLGWVIGGAATYFIGYWAGHPLIRRTNVYRKIESYQSEIPRHFAFWLVLLFRLAMPAEVPGYVLGSLRYSFSRYILATILAEIPFAFLSILASRALVEKNSFAFAGSVVIGIAFFSYTFWLFKKYADKKSGPGRI